MSIGYTIKDDHFELFELPANYSYGSFEIMVVKSCPTFSAMYTSGVIDKNHEIYYASGLKYGIACCIQIINNTHRFEFRSSTCNEISFCQDILEVKFITASTSFRHVYSKGTIINRLDLFFPPQSLQMLSPHIIDSLELDDYFSVELRQLDHNTQKMRKALNKEVRLPLNESICGTVYKIMEIINSAW